MAVKLNREQRRKEEFGVHKNYFTKNYNNPKAKINAFSVLPTEVQENIIAFKKSRKVVKPMSKNKLNKLKKVT